jgi:glucokinase
MKYLGIDIGGTSVKLGLVTDKGKILASDNYEVAFDNYKTPIFETVKKSIERFLKDNSIKKMNLWVLVFLQLVKLIVILELLLV